MKSGMIKVAVSAIIEETPLVKKFTFVPTEETSLPKFSGGSHITTIVQNGSEVIERSYSLTTDSTETKSYSIAIQRSDQSKGGSIYWHDEMEVGNELYISYPKNHFILSFAAKQHLFFAAGIGITPFLTMMAELKRKGKSFKLHYAARSKELCAFYDYLITHYKEYVQFYFSNEQQRLTSDIMKDQKIGSHVYFCGPEEMVKQFTEKAKEYGYPKRNIHFELFAAQDMGSKHSFKVKLTKSKTEILIPEGKTLLEVLLKNDVNAPYSCRIGGCGSCQVDVVSGEVDHRDSFLTDEEKNMNVMMTCVSRAKSDYLELDL